MNIGTLSSAASLLRVNPVSRPNPPAPTASPAPTGPRPEDTSALDASVLPQHPPTATSPATVSPLYTTTISGKTYSGNVEYAAGLYVVSVPGLLGATATGTTPLAAENRLGPIISELA